MVGLQTTQSCTRHQAAVPQDVHAGHGAEHRAPAAQHAAHFCQRGLRSVDIVLDRTETDDAVEKSGPHRAGVASRRPSPAAWARPPATFPRPPPSNRGHRLRSLGVEEGHPAGKTAARFQDAGRRPDVLRTQGQFSLAVRSGIPVPVQDCHSASQRFCIDVTSALALPPPRCSVKGIAVFALYAAKDSIFSAVFCQVTWSCSHTGDRPVVSGRS